MGVSVCFITFKRFEELDLNAYKCLLLQQFNNYEAYSGNNIARKENGTSICHVVSVQESKTSPSESKNLRFSWIEIIIFDKLIVQKTIKYGRKNNIFL